MRSSIIIISALVVLLLAASAQSLNNKNKKNMPINFGSGYPLSLRTCHPNHATQRWIFDTNTSLVRSATDPQNRCLETWMGVGADHMVTIWTCDLSRVGGGSNFFYIWNETSSRAQQKDTNLCFGYKRDEHGETVRTLDCTIDATNTRLVRKKFSSSSATEYTLETPNGLCVGLPMPYTEYVQVQNDQFQIGVAINGFAPEHNITYLGKFKIWQPEFQQWSINLLDWTTMRNFAYFSTSSITVRNTSSNANKNSSSSSWLFARGGRVTEKTSTRVRIDDIYLGTENNKVATEGWLIETIGTSFRWEISRVYGGCGDEQLEELTSRYATFIPRSMWSTVGRNGYGLADQSPIISTLDTHFKHNVTSASGFYVPLGPHQVQEGGEEVEEFWTYSFTDRASHAMLWSPMDVCLIYSKTLDNNHTPVDFSYQSPGTTGVQGFNSIGLIATNPAPVKVSNNNGAPVVVDFSLDVPAPSHPENHCGLASTLRMDTNNATRDRLAQSTGRLFEMFKGNIVGNSPASTVCIFETSIHAQILSVFAPPKNAENPQALPDLFAAFRSELQFFFDAGIVNASNGHVLSQWSSGGWALYGVDGVPSMFQQQTQFLNGIYHYIVTTGDYALLAERWPQMKKALNYLLKDMMLKEKKVAVAFGAANGLKNPTQSSDWLDIIGVGWMDAIIAAEAVQVLRHYAELANEMSEPLLSEELKTLHSEAVAKYNELFWNEDLAMYATWVDKDNKRHSYNYLWNNALALDPSTGIVGDNATRARLVLDSTDNNLERVRRQMNKSADDLWCTPTNFISVAPDHQVQQQAFGHYENGAMFMMLCGFEIKMRFDGNQTKRGIELFDRAMTWFKKSHLWGQHFKWATGFQMGHFADGDVLVDSNMLLWGFLRGAMRIRPTMTTIVVEGEPGPELEGAHHTFYHLGDLWTATVVNGKTVVEKYSDKNKKSRVDVAGIVMSAVAVLTVAMMLIAYKLRSGSEEEGEKLTESGATAYGAVQESV